MEQNQQPQPPVFNQPQQAPQQVPRQPMLQYQPRVTARPMMSPVESVMTCWSKCFVFKGRARRSEFWWYILFYLIMYIALSWLGGYSPALAIVCSVCSFLLFIPQFAAVTRRMHDTGHSGWGIFAIFILFLFYMGTMISLLAPLGVDMLNITDPMEMAMAMMENIQAHPVLATINSFSSFFAIILLIVTLIFAIKDSDWTANKYGPSPKYS